jgi:hypothetical protein
METYPPLEGGFQLEQKKACFQFVKRMNGNGFNCQSVKEGWLFLLPIREAYEWKQKQAHEFQTMQHRATCFQFVKRMNGNQKLKSGV